MSCTFYYADMTVTYHFLTFNAATLPLKALMITSLKLPYTQSARKSEYLDKILPNMLCIIRTAKGCTFIIS